MVTNIAFSKTLIDWYLQNKRDLPWRNTKDPYKIWLSEIILQQTKVDQGMAYYQKFATAFPTVFDLAKAKQDTILKLWQGLGYYSRARNLHASANYIVTELQGVFPKNHEGLLVLKGVGDYTASAIASICYNAPTAVVDGNVYRVLARYFGIYTPINVSAGIKEFKLLAQQLLNKKDTGTHNQAMMEYGATICKPQNPLCQKCDLQTACVAFNENSIKELPVKIKTLKIKKRYFNFLVLITSEGKTILQERTKKGIWQHLYQFPLIESDALLTKEKLVENEVFKAFFPKQTAVSLFNKEVIIHKLSHQHLITRFWIVKTEYTTAETISWETTKKYAVPVLIDNFLQAVKIPSIF